MCNLSQGIRENAIDEKTKDVAERMIRAGKYSDADIVDISGLTLSQVEVLREELKADAMT